VTSAIFGLVIARRLALGLVLAMSAACSKGGDASPEDAAPETLACDEGFEAHDGICVAKLEDCDDRSVPKLGGGCVPIGVPDDGCAPGFSTDKAGGCEPILPKDKCPLGKMAVVGETTCRDIAPCGTGTWGDIPVDSTTLYVDLAYTGGASDGTKDKPFTTIAAAIAAASVRDDTIIAIAAGKYVENLTVNRPVKLWGRCPSMVEIAGAPDQKTTQTLTITREIEIHRLAVTGPYIGIGVYGKSDIPTSSAAALIDETWIHDNAFAGIEAIWYDVPSKVTLRNSLVEQNKQAGVAAFAAVVLIEKSLVRDNLPTDAKKFGFGVTAWERTGKPADVTIRASLLEGNSVNGAAVLGGKLTVEGTVVRGTKSDLLTGAGGEGVGGSVREKVRPEVHVSKSLFEGNQKGGLNVSEGDITVDRTVFRRNLPQTIDKRFGLGIAFADDSRFTMTDCLVERNMTVGIASVGARGTIERTIVRDTQPGSDESLGVGIQIAPNDPRTFTSDVTLRSVRVQRSRYAGISIFGSKVRIEGSAVLDTAAGADGGKFGDGVGMRPDNGLGGVDLVAEVAMDGTLITRSARAGLGVFGASLSLQGSRITCNLFDFHAQRRFGAHSDGTPWEHPFELTDLGNNACGCGTKLTLCVSSSEELDTVGR